VCDTYQSVLLAYVSEAYEARLDVLLFNDGSLFTESILGDEAEVQDKITARAGWTLETIVSQIQAGRPGIPDRAWASSQGFFPYLQVAVSMGDIKGMVQYLSDRMNAGALTMDQLRFSTHLLLAFHDVRAPVPADDVQSLLSQYVRGLVSLKSFTAVPVYILALPQKLRALQFAQFVAEMPSNEWRAQLRNALSQRLDVPVIVRALANLVLKREAYSEMPETCFDNVMAAAELSIQMFKESEKKFGLSVVVPIINGACRILIGKTLLMFYLCFFHTCLLNYSSEKRGFDLLSRLVDALEVGTLDQDDRNTNNYVFWELKDYKAYVRWSMLKVRR
jgi:hypothetical protein